MKIPVHNVVEEPGGKSRFVSGELELAPVADVSPGGVFNAVGLGDAGVGIVVFDAGFECGFHNTPAPTWMFLTSGRIEIEVSDGDAREFKAGDIVHFSDAAGQGHRSKVLGDEEVIAATAGFNP